MDYGSAAGSYVDAFMDNIDWDGVHARYQNAVSAASEPLGTDADALSDAPDGPLLLDVRRAGVFEQARTMIPGARWRDPAAVASWGSELLAERDVVVYCVHGHEVSRATAVRLRAAGVQARYLRGGIEAWQARGGALAHKPEQPPAP
jgi:Fe-Mn family superoxide dismutase